MKLTIYSKINVIFRLFLLGNERLATVAFGGGGAAVGVAPATGDEKEPESSKPGK